MVQKKWVGEDKVSAVISCFSDTDGSDSRHLRETCVCVCSEHSRNISVHSYAMVHIITSLPVMYEQKKL